MHSSPGIDFAFFFPITRYRTRALFIKPVAKKKIYARTVHSKGNFLGGRSMTARVIWVSVGKIFRSSRI